MERKKSTIKGKIKPLFRYLFIYLFELFTEKGSVHVGRFAREGYYSTYDVPKAGTQSVVRCIDVKGRDLEPLGTVTPRIAGNRDRIQNEPSNKQKKTRKKERKKARQVDSES